MYSKIFIYGGVGDDIGYVELLDTMGDDLRIANAARETFAKETKEFSKRDEDLLKYLLDNRHTSPFEHCKLTFRVKVPLFVRSQHMRHRMANYNEVSRRYTSENLEFYLPRHFRSQHDNNHQASNDDKIDPVVVQPFSGFVDPTTATMAVGDIAKRATETYESMLKAGIAREQARMVLPQNLYTEYWNTQDLHNLMHFLSLRNHPHAQWEIKKVAEAMQMLASNKFPVTMKIFKEANNG